MLNLAEYRQRPALLADWLPWAGLIAPGVVLNKDGSFQRTVRFRGPDLDSATQGELIATSARLNNALRRLGSGWALFIEAERRPAADYPHSEFPEPLSWLVDEERRATFEESGNDFESGYHLTLVYLPPEESRARAAKMLYENTPTNGVDWRERLQAFVAETDRVFDLLGGVMPEIDWLDDAQTLTYLHATISTRRYRVGVPEVPFHIDALLTDSALVGGLAPMLGDQHLRVVSVRGFRPRPGRGFWTTSTVSALPTAGARAFSASTNPRRNGSWDACAASGSPSARMSSRCCAKRSSSRKAGWSIPTRTTRRRTRMQPCRSWAAIKSPSAI